MPSTPTVTACPPGKSQCADGFKRPRHRLHIASGFSPYFRWPRPLSALAGRRSDKRADQLLPGRRTAPQRSLRAITAGKRFFVRAVSAELSWRGVGLVGVLPQLLRNGAAGFGSRLSSSFYLEWAVILEIIRQVFTELFSAECSKNSVGRRRAGQLDVCVQRRMFRTFIPAQGSILNCRNGVRKGVSVVETLVQVFRRTPSTVLGPRIPIEP